MTAIREDICDGIRYRERPGSGPVVVFLHGIGSNAGSFGPILSRLPSGVRGIAWNAPGYGGSRRLALDWPVAADYAEALAGFLDGLGVERAVIVGHSLGTLMGAAFAARDPARVAHLVLASCACGYGVRPGDPLPAGVQKRIDDLLRQGPEAFARDRAARLVFEPENNPDLVEQVRRGMAAVDLDGYPQAVRMLGAGDLPAALRDVHVPTGFIIGVNDQVTPEQQTIDAATAWGQSNARKPMIERIERAGHAVYLQAPDAFIAALGRLAGLDPLGTQEGM
ncbi:MAG: alpha/beta fold hydrolase [Qingshengfaniella sp.]